MPYKRYARKRTFRRRTRRSARPWYAKKYSVASLASKAMRGVWKLKGLVNSERYKKDLSLGPTPVTNTGVLTPMHEIAIGDADNQRTGNSIFVRSLNIKGYVNWNSSGNNPQCVRLSVVMDTQQVGDSSPTFTDIYEAATPYSHLNSDTVGRFKVLFSRNYLVNSQFIAQMVNINIPMRHHIRYNGSAGTDIQKGGLYFVQSSDQSTSNYPSFIGESRLTYHDN